MKGPLLDSRYNVSSYITSQPHLRFIKGNKVQKENAVLIWCCIKKFEANSEIFRKIFTFFSDFSLL